MTAVRDLRFTPAPASLARAGMLGWVSFRLGDGWLVDGVTVRRTLGGELRLSFPTRTDRSGRKRVLLRPASDEARCEIERAVLAQLRSEVAP